MQSSIRILVAVCLITLATVGRAVANEISGSISGTIGNGSTTFTTDTLGIFGPAGGNLSGDAISISYGYNAQDLTQVSLGGNGNSGVAYVNYGTSATPYFSVTINGVTQTYTPSIASSGLQFENSNPDNVFSELLYTSPATDAEFVLYTTNSFVFGQPVLPSLGNQGVLLVGSNGVPFLGDELAFTVTSFTPEPVPEPSTASLLGACGVLGLVGVAWRRFRDRSPMFLHPS